MTNANYVRHFKVLGKLAYLFDNASATAPDQQALLAAFVDQYADGAVDSLSAISLFPAWTQQWLSAINSGATAMINLAKQAASAYLGDATFRNDLTTVPANSSASAVLAALQTEMSAAVDDKTLTTKAATGLVNFFDAILGEAGTWNTEADATADYKDSVYVVATVV